MRAIVIDHFGPGLHSLVIAVPTVKTRAHRARLLLRKRLSTFMEIERGSETEVQTRPSEG